jgi:hypothetical protein
MPRTASSGYHKVQKTAAAPCSQVKAGPIVNSPAYPDSSSVVIFTSSLMK